MNKIIDLRKTVAELCKAYPELKEIMAEIGFKDITKPLALQTMGRIMTIPKGAFIKDIPLRKIVEALEKNGFEVENIPDDGIKNDSDKEEEQAGDVDSGSSLTEKEILLKSYIQRLTAGDNLELVREEFIKNFTDVSALEIIKAEQTLVREGTSLDDMQKLCDIHSALFHGATQTEQIAEADKELNPMAAGFDTDIANKTRNYMQEIGHPLQILTLENEAIAKLLEEIELLKHKGHTIKQLEKQIRKLTTIAQHYGKKDELIFPLLKDKYGYPGPSDVMWGVEDEIRSDLRQALSAEPEEEDQLTVVLKRIREMIYKEENILFPLSVSLFTEEEWIAIAKDMPMFGPCMIDEIPTWDKISKTNAASWTAANRVTIPGGSFTLTQLRAMLNTIPMELTLIDENDINSYFNEGEKLFTRPMMAIGRSVYSCHPKRVEPMVRMLIHDFKKGKRTSMHILSEKCGKTVVINYYALRDDDGNYLGTMEAVQELEGIKDALIKGRKGPI